MPLAVVGMENDGLAVRRDRGSHIDCGLTLDGANPALRLFVSCHEVITAEMTGKYQSVHTRVLKADGKDLGCRVRDRILRIRRNRSDWL